MRRRARGTVLFGITLAVLMSAVVLLQAERDRRAPAVSTSARYLYVPSGRVMQRIVLSFDALASDVYWIRALQYYGGTTRSTDPGKRYDLLYPLLDLATTLDPFFNIAYRFGAIFLTEAYPNGPGRPDQALALLKKGLAARPMKWQYAMDIGFVHYWWLHDYEAAARWFDSASTINGSPWWLKTLAATTLAQGGERQASKLLWQQLGDSAADNEWLRNESRRRLLQLTALDDLDRLLGIIERYIKERGQVPGGWEDLVRSGYLREVPRDPTGEPYVLDSRAGQLSLSSASPLFPLPAEPPALPNIGAGRKSGQ